jgi:hypothetical protein
MGFFKKFFPKKPNGDKKHFTIEVMSNFLSVHSHIAALE